MAPADAIRRYNRYYVAVYASNAKLLLGRETLWQEWTPMRSQRDAVNARWTKAIMRDHASRNPNDSRKKEVLELSVRAAIAMVDELLREIYLHRAPSLVKFAEDQELLADVISDIWFRMIYTRPI